MMEADDRLEGDTVWELFPARPVGDSPRRLLDPVSLAALLVIGWMIFPPFAVLVACVAASAHDFQSGLRAARVNPDKAVGRICSLFGYAWGAWKFGAAGFGMLFVCAYCEATQHLSEEVPPSAIASMLFCVAGFLASAVLTAVGLVMAFRSGMRIWIGEEINRVKTLLLGMFLVGFIGVALIAANFLLSTRATGALDSDAGLVPSKIALLSLRFGIPVALLITLDRLTRRIVDDRPGKFGPKVQAVRKWG